MGKLAKLAKKTDIMDVKIKYGNQLIKFNLHEELIINENRINEEIKEQPTHYAYLCLLLNKLERIKNDKKAELNKVAAKLFIKYKNKIDPKTHRPYNNDLVEAMVINNKDHSTAEDNYFKAEQDWGTIKSAVGAFDQRSSLIQSLSANVRNERTNS